MENVKKLLNEILTAELIQINLSNTRDVQQAAKAKIRPVLIGGKLMFQETLYRGTQVFHSNHETAEMQERIEDYLVNLFKQLQIRTTAIDATVLVSKKGHMTIRRKVLTGENKELSLPRTVAGQAQGGVSNGCVSADNTGASEAKDVKPQVTLEHNRTKQYILQDGKPVDFLVGLGVQTPDGRVTKARYDKFRQINRYLEFIEDVLEQLPTDRTIRIIDFGCGKSYLTFAMYYYLHVLQGRDIQVTGLDLKKDVIRHCNELAERLGYERLHFEHGDIAGYTGADVVDMVVTLHACDTATDYAIAKAVKWNAQVIMVVPCCQHEVNKQISCAEWKPVLKYGLIKERMSALLTDAFRANLMEQAGYDTQILEFIDMEHTPKNLLIRGVKRKGMRSRGKGNDIGALTRSLNLELTLDHLLKDNAE